MTNNNDRLDRIEALVESNARAIELNTRNLAETKKITESNGKAIQAMQGTTS